MAYGAEGSEGTKGSKGSEGSEGSEGYLNMPLDASGIIHKSPLRIFNGNVFNEIYQWYTGWVKEPYSC